MCGLALWQFVSKWWKKVHLGINHHSIEPLNGRVNLNLHSQRQEKMNNLMSYLHWACMHTCKILLTKENIWNLPSPIVSNLLICGSVLSRTQKRLYLFGVCVTSFPLFLMHNREWDRGKDSWGEGYAYSGLDDRGVVRDHEDGYYGDGKRRKFNNGVRGVSEPECGTHICSELRRFTQL